MENLGYTYTAIGNRLTQTTGGVTTNYIYAPHSSQLTGIKTGATNQTVGNTPTGNSNSFSPALGSVTVAHIQSSQPVGNSQRRRVSNSPNMPMMLSGKGWSK